MMQLSSELYLMIQHVNKELKGINQKGAIAELQHLMLGQEIFMHLVITELYPYGLLT